MRNHSREPSSTNPLKLFVPDSGTRTPGQLGPGMTLLEFFEEWYLKIVLGKPKKPRKPATIRAYRDSLKHWRTATGDPPLAEIDETTIDRFVAYLVNDATYRRGQVGALRRLEEYTQRKHLRNVKAVLDRSGPTRNPTKPSCHNGRGLLEFPPYIEVEQAEASKKRPPFRLDVAKQLVAATHRMKPTKKLDRSLVGAWWRAFLLVSYFTGLRSGTVLKLRRDMIDARDDGHWLIIPGSIVDKTSKSLDKWLHPSAYEAVQRCRTGGDLLLDWPHDRRYLNTCHEKLQRLAGIPKQDWLSPHTWRRTHSQQMGLLGARAGLKVAQLALDHADDRTTSNFYCDLEPALMRNLPLLDAPAPTDAQGLLFDPEEFLRTG